MRTMIDQDDGKACLPILLFVSLLFISLFVALFITLFVALFVSLFVATLLGVSFLRSLFVGLLSVSLLFISLLVGLLFVSTVVVRGLRVRGSRSRVGSSGGRVRGSRSRVRGSGGRGGVGVLRVASIGGTSISRAGGGLGKPVGSAGETRVALLVGEVRGGLGCLEGLRGGETLLGVGGIRVTDVSGTDGLHHTGGKGGTGGLVDTLGGAGSLGGLEGGLHLDGGDLSVGLFGEMDAAVEDVLEGLDGLEVEGDLAGGALEASLVVGSVLELELFLSVDGLLADGTLVGLRSELWCSLRSKKRSDQTRSPSE